MITHGLRVQPMGAATADGVCGGPKLASVLLSAQVRSLLSRGATVAMEVRTVRAGPFQR